MSNKMLTKVENEILGSLIRELVDEGYEVRTEDHGAEMFLLVYDGENESKEEADGFVKFVWGNAEDCISDYSTKLETIIKPSTDLSEAYRD